MLACQCQKVTQCPIAVLHDQLGHPVAGELQHIAAQHARVARVARMFRLDDVAELAAVVRSRLHCKSHAWRGRAQAQDELADRVEAQPLLA
jgi:hypothetical protein